MPRSRSRSGPYRTRTARKPGFWAQSSFSNQVLTVGNLAFADLTSTSATDSTPGSERQEGTTLRRSIGKVFLRPTANNQPTFGWHGIIKVRQENLLVAELPPPTSEVYDWVFQAYWNIEVSNIDDAAQQLKLDFDLKAQRRFQVNDHLAYIIQVDSGAAASVEWSSAWRLFFR